MARLDNRSSVVFYKENSGGVANVRKSFKND